MEEQAEMEKIASRYKHIKGWGVDADPANEPTYPMKHWTGADHDRLDYPRPEQQPVDVEILHSNERPSVTAVFGTSTPPAGLSGALRRFAFRYSESDLRHWMPLVLADRVNVAEGLLADLAHGHVPNIFAEKGWGVDWKYNRSAYVRRAAVAAAVGGLAFLIFRKKKR